jgi:hypothetical protein
MGRQHSPAPDSNVLGTPFIWRSANRQKAPASDASSKSRIRNFFTRNLTKKLSDFYLVVDETSINL